MGYGGEEHKNDALIFIKLAFYHYFSKTALLIVIVTVIFTQRIHNNGRFSNSKHGSSNERTITGNLRLQGGGSVGHSGSRRWNCSTKTEKTATDSFHVQQLKVAEF